MILTSEVRSTLIDREQNREPDSCRAALLYVRPVLVEPILQLLLQDGVLIP
jgi:hypothetical protein